MKHSFPPFWFIFDVESIGLHGEAFAVAWQIFNHNADPIPGRNGAWVAMDRNLARGTVKNHQWVTDNVPPLKTEYPEARGVRDHFWCEWEHAKEHYPGIVMAAECAWPVEARFLIACVEDLPNSNEFNGPYPLHDIASIMLAAGMDPMATYPRVHEDLDLYPPHHPLGDVQHSAHCLAMALRILRANSRTTEPENFHCRPDRSLNEKTEQYTDGPRL